MKAEHRKELETNALADRVGRAVEGMKQAPQKKTLLLLLLGGVVLVVVFFIYRKGQLQIVENAQQWAEFEDGAGPYLQKLVELDPASNQAKGARFEFTYSELRHMLRLLATNPKQAQTTLDVIAKNYQELAKLCKDDKVLLPEALFAQAVIEETKIIKDDDNWKAALSAYKEVADNHPDSAFGKIARKRVEVLDNKDKRDNLLNVYRDLRIEFVREERTMPSVPGLPEGHPPIPPDLPGLPKPEPSKAETPKAEAPKTDAPKTDVPKVDTPKTKAEAPKTEPPKADAPKK